MVQDPHLKEIFPKPPLVSYRRQKNIRETVIRAAVPPPPKREQRKRHGMTKCNKAKCVTCSYVKVGKSIKSNANNFTVDINCEADCTTTNSVYCLSCLKCGLQYIGTTKKEIKERFKEHKGYVTNFQNHQDKITGAHFNLPGHSVSDMRISVLEKVFNPDPMIREQREKYFINKFEAKYKGMNRKNG